MIGLNYKLEQLEEARTPILAAIIGAGQMGRGMVAQMTSMQGMRPAVLVDRTLQKVKDAFNNAGLIEGRDYQAADTIEAASGLLAQGIRVAATKTELATHTPAIHCVVEATGVPDVGAKVALDAIDNKKHIVMLNVEADVCIGHILYQRAQEAGVVYTGSAGDEPGAVMELYDFSKALGFDVRVIGKGKNNPIDYGATPHSVAEEALRRGIGPRMLAAFKDGTKTMVELTAMANATGFLPDIPGAHGPKAGVADLPQLLSLKSEAMGGILSSYGVVEYIDGIAPGVFVIISTEQPDALHELNYLSMGEGPNFCLYRPYHLCSLETPISVARAVLYQEPTIVPRAGLIAETGTVAKINLFAGDALDGIGGFCLRGTFLSAKETREKNILPIGLITPGAKMRRAVKQGDFVTYDDVELDEKAQVVRLRRLQDQMFF